ncbi:hypothetical protein [Microcoleus sp. N9_A1]|uniref:hypothetical protein n=1 Tax=Microcoleus sp. N9_A1 TaxID=3055380 RepID=UPI002FD3A3E3
MKIIFQLMLGYFAVAIFAAKCGINPKILPTSVGDRHGTPPVEGILIQSQKHSYLRSASRPLTSASPALFLDKLSPIEAVQLPTYNYIQSQDTPRKEPTIRLSIIGHFLVFIFVLISLLIRGKTVNSLSKTMRLIKPKSETENDKLPKGEKVLYPKKELDIWHTIAQMTQDLQQTAEYALDICEEMNVSIIATTPGGHKNSYGMRETQRL